MHIFLNGHPLITTVQATCQVILLQFSGNNRDLLHTFVFDKFALFDVIIPGRDLEIHVRMPIDAIQPLTKFQVKRVSITMENVSIFVSNNIFYPSYGTLLLEWPLHVSSTPWL